MYERLALKVRLLLSTVTVDFLYSLLGLSGLDGADGIIILLFSPITVLRFLEFKQNCGLAFVFALQLAIYAAFIGQGSTM